MNRYRAYWPLDDAPLKDGDGGFVGVDERMDPNLVKPGFVSSATNCRFRNGLVEPRPGITILPWMKADGRTPFTTTGAMHVFKVSPPLELQGWVGAYNDFAQATLNDRIIGLRFGETVAIKSIEVRQNGLWNQAWKTVNDGKSYPVGVLVNGQLYNTAYTLDLTLSAQEIQIATSLDTATIPSWVEVRAVINLSRLCVGRLTYAT